VVDLDAALGQQLLDVPVGEAEAQIPADRYDNDIGWEAEAGEGRSSAGTGSGRRGLMLAVCLLGSAHCRCNSARWTSLPHVGDRSDDPHEPATHL
jgi:hypothetical protein